jgi:hypothetical protein
MPRGFLLPPIFGVRLIGADYVLHEADFWVPFKLDSFPQRRDNRMLFVLGRLKDGRSIEEARAETSTIAGRLAADYTVDDLGMDFSVVPLDKQVLTTVQTLLVLLLIVGALVLIIAETNAAHLLRVDSLTMSGETAVRSALGASAGRLAAGQGTLGILWCALATGGALIVAAAMAAPVAAYTKANVPRLSEVKLDAGVGAVALALGVALAIAISLLPIVYARKAGSARSASATPAPAGMSKWRRLFVVLQLAVAIIVLSTAALLYRSADRLADVNPGFVAEGVSVFEFMLPESRYGTPVRRIELQRRLLELVGDLPGRQSAATVDVLPFGGDNIVLNMTIENHVVTDTTAKPRATLRAVSANYFQVLSIPTVGGRQFVTGDEAEGASVAVVNEAFVRRFVPTENIIGRRIKRGIASTPTPWMTVVGVVGSVRAAGLGVDPAKSWCPTEERHVGRGQLNREDRNASANARPRGRRAYSPRRCGAFTRVHHRHERTGGARGWPTVLLRPALRRAGGRRVPAEPGRRLQRGGAGCVGPLQRNRHPELSRRAVGRHRTAHPA